LLPNFSYAEGFVDLPPVIDEFPYIGKYLSSELKEKLKLIKYYENTGFRDQYHIYVYAVTEEIDGSFVEHTSLSTKLHSLPLSDSEFEIYIDECFGWPLYERKFLEDYDLLSERCSGYWYYSGSYDASKRRPYCYLGWHEMLLYLEHSGILIYMNIDT